MEKDNTCKKIIITNDTAFKLSGKWGSVHLSNLLLFHFEGKKENWATLGHSMYLTFIQVRVYCYYCIQRVRIYQVIFYTFLVLFLEFLFIFCISAFY